MAGREEVWPRRRREYDRVAGRNRGHRHQARSRIHRHGYAASRYAIIAPIVHHQTIQSLDQCVHRAN